MSSDPNKDAPTPDDLLAQTQDLLGDSTDAALEPAAGTPTPSPSKKSAPTPSSSAGMSAGMWVSLILGAIIVVLLLIFIVQNNVPADFRYFGWTFRLPLGVAMLFSALGGILVAGIIGSTRIFVLSRRLKKIEKAFKK